MSSTTCRRPTVMISINMRTVSMPPAGSVPMTRGGAPLSATTVPWRRTADLIDRGEVVGFLRCCWAPTAWWRCCSGRATPKRVKQSMRASSQSARSRARELGPICSLGVTRTANRGKRRRDRIGWCRGRRITDQRAAVAIVCGCELTDYVLAEERDVGGADAVADAQDPARVASGFGEAQRRCRPERDVAQIEEIRLAEACHQPAKVDRSVELEHTAAAGSERDSAASG